MGNMIPQKSFEEQLHIIRDVRFDVDKYRIDELYVINQKVENALLIDNKVVGILSEVTPYKLKFKIPTLYNGLEGIFWITEKEFTLDEVIKGMIEIECLYTETETIIRVNEELERTKHHIEISDDSEGSKNINSSIQNKTLNQLDKMKNYTIDIFDPDTRSNNGSVSFLNDDMSFNVSLFKSLKGRVRFTFKKDESVFRMNIPIKNIDFTEERITIRYGTLNITLWKNNFGDMFDNISIIDQQ